MSAAGCAAAAERKPPSSCVVNGFCFHNVPLAVLPSISALWNPVLISTERKTHCVSYDSRGGSCSAGVGGQVGASPAVQASEAGNGPLHQCVGAWFQPGGRAPSSLPLRLDRPVT